MDLSTQLPTPGTRDIDSVVPFRVPHYFPTAWDLAGLPHSFSTFSRARILSQRGRRSSSSSHCVQPDTTRKPRPGSLLQLDAEKTAVCSRHSFWAASRVARLVLLLLAPLLCRPSLDDQLLSSFLRPHVSSLTSSVTLRWSASALDGEKVIQCSGCGVNRTRSAHSLLCRFQGLTCTRTVMIPTERPGYAVGGGLPVQG